MPRVHNFLHGQLARPCHIDVCGFITQMQVLKGE
jgi:hypothetical protein